MQKIISIIYCYRNREIERVKNSLDSLTIQTNTHFEVIFVDYGSGVSQSKHMEALCKSYKFCNYVYIDSEGKLWNRAEALNYGIFFCKTEYVFTADVDLIFKAGFIDALYAEAEVNTAKFYSVGYLSENETKKLNLNSIEQLAFTKSEEFALGMVLLSKNNMLEVNGYNNFYSIWGMEDNDLKKRLEKRGVKTKFLNEIKILHQYHPPMNTTVGKIPEGWVQYLKDYFENQGAAGNENNGLDKVKAIVNRPARKLRDDKNIAAVKMNVRNLFVRHLLIQEVNNVKTKQMFYAFSYTDSHIQSKSNVIKIIGVVNKIFRVLSLPMHAVSDFKSQNITKEELTSEIYFVVKCLENKIEDYWISEEKDEVKLIIIKK